MPNTKSFYAIALCVGLFAQPAFAELRVSDNGRYLVEADGTPFFYLADTAWELFHRLDREEVDLYLADRASRGFTVIQAVALAELDGLRTPNAYGHRPLRNNDPAFPATEPGPRNDYWDHVDEVIDKAESLGLYVGLLPTWGDKWNLKWGVGPEVFTPENARQYGRWLGERYAEKPIIWIIGGDRPIESDRHREIVVAMVRGIRQGDRGRNLMTFHPCGSENSADYFHDAEWLDFNMIQSGHSRPAMPNYRTISENYRRTPIKPTLDGEPCYEDHPIKGELWDKRNQPGVYLPWFDEWNVRKAAYQSMLAGSSGHTYGSHSVWQMWSPEWQPISIARTPWPDALNQPGAQQMAFFRQLFEARPFWKLKPAPELVATEGDSAVLAARAADDAFVIAYAPEGESVALSLGDIFQEGCRGYWFNPRQNSAQLIGSFDSIEERDFSPPTTGRNNDWILVLDNATHQLPRLGSSYQHLFPKSR